MAAFLETVWGLDFTPVPRRAAMSSALHPDAARPLEAGITTDLRERLTYSGYLRLDVLLAAQQPRSAPDNHDER